MSRKLNMSLWACAAGLMLGQAAGLAQPLPPAPPNWWTNTIPFGWTNSVWWTNAPPPRMTNSSPQLTNSSLPLWTNTAPIFTNVPPAWTNILTGHTNFQSAWTNIFSLTNRPSSANPTNIHSRVIAAGQSGPASLPKDARALVNQFQQQRNQLLNALNNASDQQRQEILGQMEALRQQLVGQLQEFRQMAIDQAHAMQGAFNNGGSHFAPGNAGQNPSGPGSHGGPPRH